MKKIVVLICLSIVFLLGTSQTTPPAKTVPVCQYYEGGQAAMYTFINSQVIYPPMAKRNRLQGECIISFSLNEDGTTSGHTVVKNIGGGCGEEAARVVKLLKFKAPGFKSQNSVPIIFKL
ncbi:MAG: energy transducer TonB [Cytophagaceae bacterium]|jgi:protein TonB|nr:energy transducer TonB [Cytophagaceae bacterium]